MPEPTGESKQSRKETARSEDAAHAAGGENTKAVPEGIVPLFFSAKSQEIFQCVADTELTPENPHKLILKEKIAEDFKNRAAVSDFFHVKQKVLVSTKRAFLNKAHVLIPPSTLCLHTELYWRRIVVGI